MLVLLLGLGLRAHFEMASRSPHPVSQACHTHRYHSPEMDIDPTAARVRQGLTAVIDKRLTQLRRFVDKPPQSYYTSEEFELRHPRQQPTSHATGALGERPNPNPDPNPTPRHMPNAFGVIADLPWDPEGCGIIWAGGGTAHKALMIIHCLMRLLDRTTLYITNHS